jgi:hypothetical protein
MSYSMLVLGELRLPPEVSPRFKKLPVAPEDGGPWLDNLSIHLQARPTTVDALIRRLPSQLIAQAGSWLRFGTPAECSGLTVQGILGEDDFLDHGVELAELFRVAAQVGGEGELYFLEEQTLLFGEREPEECYLVKVVPSASAVRHPSQLQQRQVLLSEAFGSLAEEIISGFDAETQREFREGLSQWRKRSSRAAKGSQAKRKPAKQKPPKRAAPSRRR